MFQEDPVAAETAFRNAVYGFARSVLGDAFEQLDGQGPHLEVDGERFRKVDATTGRAMTLLGPVDYSRSRYRPLGGGASVVPTDRILGLTESGLTPAGGAVFRFV